MKNIITISVIAIILISSKLNAQNFFDNIWIFGDSAGLNFNNNNITSFKSNTKYLTENFATISNSNGELLFYLNGGEYIPGNIGNLSRIYNSDSVMMENGDSIRTDYSQTQGTMIIPDPYDSLKYFIINIQQQFDVNGSPNNLYYSIIDLSFNNGLGKVISKNNLLIQYQMQEKIAAVKKSNGVDWWIITHKANSDQFAIYEITQQGIQGPFLQSIGPYMPYPSDKNPCISFGQMKISKNGNKLVYASMGLETLLFDFDRCEGILSNIQVITNLNETCSGYYGCSFSSSGRFLYLSNYNSLYQFDLENDNISNTSIELWNLNNFSPQFAERIIGQHQIGPDDKIYIASSSGIDSSIANNLSVINYPDSLGVLSGFNSSSVNLSGGSSTGGLPNYPNYRLTKMNDWMCDSINNTIKIKNDPKILIYPNPNDGNFKLISSDIKDLNIEVFNIHGELKLKSDFESNSKIDIDTNLPNGIYIWLAFSKNIMISKGRFIVMQND